MTQYESVIGLEIHVELATKSKMFCSCSADYFQKDPNTHTCPVCLGLPGAMPVANKMAIKYTQMLGQALNCKLQLNSKFDRKNYFYPDLAKGFQISQYDLPFSQKGCVDILIDGKPKKIGVTRAHLEEDTGKLLHTKLKGKTMTLIDFNRSGVPLVEIVSEPDMTSSLEAKIYAQKIQQIIRYLKVSDCDMEKGSMRIEPNVSLREVGKESKSQRVKELPLYKVELKNINSFKFVEKAIEFEISRQKDLLEKGETPKQETRGWDEAKNKTVSQRSKEEAHDYRYFPEPDIPPFVFKKEAIEEIKKSIPKLPDEERVKLTSHFNISEYSAEIVTRSPRLADFSLEAIKAGEKVGVGAKKIVDEIINKKPNISKILPAEFVEEIYKSSQKLNVPVEEIEEITKEVLFGNPKAVSDYKSGKENAIMFLLGQVMKKLDKNVDTQKVKDIIKENIK